MFTTLTTVSRKQWDARECKPRKKLNHPVKKVIIHKTNSKECYTNHSCEYLVRKLQKFHMKKDKKADIKYNFLITVNNNIYEGRGWQYQGEHTEGLDDQSIGIAFQMRYGDRPPDAEEIQLAKDIILYGIKKGYIDEDFEVIPHNALSDDIVCPGLVMLEELINFPKKLKRQKEKEKLREQSG
ncbi:peptidoglycan recognition protein 3-like [Macrosteles quadrilineatus]|uniref:peptidoglycan recognition protein 3-like n=1 Tax=Macrosteles quadrilineatus TaxID=74068 RepID=UPI0023E1B347|nr:peptidoglycan recognition protein 3-like [Macrosteles quadrilineatus]